MSLLRIFASVFLVALFSISSGFGMPPRKARRVSNVFEVRNQIRAKLIEQSLVLATVKIGSNGEVSSAATHDRLETVKTELKKGFDFFKDERVDPRTQIEIYIKTFMRGLEASISNLKKSYRADWSVNVILELMQPLLSMRAMRVFSDSAVEEAEQILFRSHSFMPTLNGSSYDQNAEALEEEEEEKTNRILVSKDEFAEIWIRLD